MTTVTVALGGNALARRGEPITAAVQQQNIERAVAALLPVLRSSWRIVLTHGNGPQVGVLLLETEADEAAGPYPLDILGAESEGMVGYLLEQELRRRLPHRPIATLLTQTAVDPDDPSLTTPRKPVGPLYDELTARRLKAERGFDIAPDTGGWRRVVPSPRPVAILQEASIGLLVAAGVTVIASGGGGVPVVLDEDGRPRGIQGVVDKDLAAVVLARAVGADMLLLLTDVDCVYSGFGTPDARAIEQLDADQARALLDSGELGAGSMSPKVQAAAEFAESGGTTIIASLEHASEAIAGRSGTRIMPNPSLPLTTGARAVDHQTRVQS